MTKIFLSYRREDTSGYAGRIVERLSAAFGQDNVFQDLDDIRPGANFVKEIQRGIASCDVLIALIGPRWLAIADTSGKRRLDDPQDFVRIEIIAALEKGIRVMPVLVQKAQMPDAALLPKALKPFSELQALELSDTRWEYDMAQLIAGLGGKASSNSPRTSRQWVVPTLLAVIATVVGWFNFQTTPMGTISNKTDASLPAKDVAGNADSPEVRSMIDVSGQWMGEWTDEGGREIRIRFDFETQGRTLMGSVRYPTGEGGIHEGKINGDQLLFVTRHIPQFEDKEVSISFAGKVSGDRIEFVMQRPSGAKRFMARRTSKHDANT